MPAPPRRQSLAAKPISSPSACRFWPIRIFRPATEDDAGLNTADPATFYAGEEKGYIDYPASH